MRAEPTIHTTMADLLAGWPSARAPLTRHGMACLGCPMARFETLGEAAAAYGVNARTLLREVTGISPTLRAAAKGRRPAQK